MVSIRSPKSSVAAVNAANVITAVNIDFEQQALFSNVPRGVLSLSACVWWTLLAFIRPMGLA